jgi:hypothetical protein
MVKSLAAGNIFADIVPVIDILPDLIFHYGVSLSGQFALQHVFDEAVKVFGSDYVGIVSSTI